MKRRATMSDHCTTAEIEARAIEVGRRLIDIGVSQRKVGRRLLRAWQDWRLHPDLAREIGVETGSYRCAVCGMLHWTERSAIKCCLPLIPCVSMILPDPYRAGAASDRCGDE